MNTIRLSQLTLRNFKGIKSLTIDFNIGNTDLFGANESGKSTVYTAFTWLLTGKDEFDRKDYEIKNTKNKELNSQAHEVEGIFDVNGKEIKLKRVYMEDWQKPRGQSTKVFKGHFTEFWYNDVPCSLSEYQTKVDSIIDSKIIKLVTNPTFFNTLKWEDQRRGLIGIAGDITDTEVFDAIATPKNDYSTLIMVLNGGKSLEEWKKELAAKKGLLKKAAVEFQPRIDEAKRNMPEVLDWETIEEKIHVITGDIRLIEEELSDASKALTERQKGIMASQKFLHEKETALNAVRFKIKNELSAQRNEVAGKVAHVKNQINEAKQKITAYRKWDQDKATNKTEYEKQIEAKDKIIEQLRNDWNTINAEKFFFDESKCECPTCKQQLPADDINSMKEELLKNFNADVTRRKADKVLYSNQVKAEIEQLKTNIAAIDEADYSKSIAAEEANIIAFEHKISELSAHNSKPVEEIEVDVLMKNNADALNYQDEIAFLKAEIESQSKLLATGVDNEKKKLEKQGLQTELDALKKQLASKDFIKTTQTRILQLETEEKANAQAIADLEQQEFEVESFTRAKMDILEKRVNGMFKYVAFRLFEVQVNGGIAETCVCEYKGVPYPTLNTAAKLLAGLDVLNTLSNFYGVYAPVFCDNRESVTFIPESKSQIISLFVSPADKKLRIEKEANKMAEAV